MSRNPEYIISSTVKRTKHQLDVIVNLKLSLHKIVLKMCFFFLSQNNYKYNIN